MLFFKLLLIRLRGWMWGRGPQAVEAKLEALRSVMVAYGSGDYETAVRAAEELARAGNAQAYCFYRGSMLTHLGRFQEAEPWLRRAVALRHEPLRLALAYSVLGENLEGQRRYDEAMKCYATALSLYPGKGSIHRHMAALQLERGDAPAGALELASLAVKEERALTSPRPGMQRVYAHNLGEALAALAWATAAAGGDRAEVDALVAEAVPLMLTGGNYQPPRAQVHYHAGRAYAALEDAARSAEHFEAAARLDPHGIWGRATTAASNGTRP